MLTDLALTYSDNQKTKSISRIYLGFPWAKSTNVVMTKLSIWKNKITKSVN